MCVSVVSAFKVGRDWKRFKSTNFKPYNNNNNKIYNHDCTAMKDRKIYEILIMARTYTHWPLSSYNNNNTIGDRSRRLFVATMKTDISKKHIRYAPKELYVYNYQFCLKSSNLYHDFFSLNSVWSNTIVVFFFYMYIGKRVNLVVELQFRN